MFIPILLVQTLVFCWCKVQPTKKSGMSSADNFKTAKSSRPPFQVTLSVTKLICSTCGCKTRSSLKSLHLRLRNCFFGFLCACCIKGQLINQNLKLGWSRLSKPIGISVAKGGLDCGENCCYHQSGKVGKTWCETTGHGKGPPIRQSGQVM